MSTRQVDRGPEQPKLPEIELIRQSDTSIESVARNKLRTSSRGPSLDLSQKNVKTYGGWKHIPNLVIRFFIAHNVISPQPNAIVPKHILINLPSKKLQEIHPDSFTELKEKDLQSLDTDQLLAALQNLSRHQFRLLKDEKIIDLIDNHLTELPLFVYKILLENSQSLTVPRQILLREEYRNKALSQINNETLSSLNSSNFNLLLENGVLAALTPEQFKLIPINVLSYVFDAMPENIHFFGKNIEFVPADILETYLGTFAPKADLLKDVRDIEAQGELPFIKALLNNKLLPFLNEVQTHAIAADLIPMIEEKLTKNEPVVLNKTLLPYLRSLKSDKAILKLNSNQIFAFTKANLTALREGQKRELSLHLLSTKRLQNFNPEHIQGLDLALMNAFKELQASPDIKAITDNFTPMLRHLVPEQLSKLNKNDFPSLFIPERIQLLPDAFIKVLSREQLQEMMDVPGLSEVAQEKLRKQRAFLNFKQLPLETFQHIETRQAELFLTEGSFEILDPEKLKAIPPQILKEINPELLAKGLGTRVQDLSEAQVRGLTAKHLNACSEDQIKKLTTYPVAEVFKDLNPSVALILGNLFINDLEDAHLEHLDHIIGSLLDQGLSNIITLLETYNEEPFQRYVVRDILIQYLYSKIPQTPENKTKITDFLGSYIALIDPSDVAWISIKDISTEDFAQTLSNEQRAKLSEEQIQDISREQFEKLTDNQLEGFTMEQLQHLMKLPSYRSFEIPLHQKIHDLVRYKEAVTLDKKVLEKVDAEKLRTLFRSGIINFLTLEQIDSIPFKAFEGLNPEDFAFIHLQHFKLIEGKHFKALKPEVVAHFTLEQVKALDRLNQIPYLTAEQLAKMPFLDLMDPWQILPATHSLERQEGISRDSSFYELSESIEGGLRISRSIAEKLEPEVLSRIKYIIETARTRIQSPEEIHKMPTVDPLFVRGIFNGNTLSPPIDLMTEEQVQAINLEALENVPPETMAHLSADTLRKFSDMQIESLPKSHISSFSPAIYKVLLDERSELLSLNQLSFFFPATLQSLGVHYIDKFNYLNKRAQAHQLINAKEIIDRKPVSTLSTFTTPEIEQLFLDNSIEFFDSESLRLFNPQAFSQIKPELLAKLQSWQIQGLPRSIFEKLSADQLNHLPFSTHFQEYVNWLSQNQIQGLSHPFLDLITPEQMAHIDSTHLEMFTEEQLQHLSAAHHKLIRDSEIEDLDPSKKNIILAKRAEFLQSNILYEEEGLVSRIYVDLPALSQISPYPANLNQSLAAQLNNESLYLTTPVQVKTDTRVQFEGITQENQKFAETPFTTVQLQNVNTTFGSNLPRNEDGFRREMLADHMYMEKYDATDGSKVLILSTSTGLEHGPTASTATRNADMGFVRSMAVGLREAQERLAPLILNATNAAHQNIKAQHQGEDEEPGKTMQCGFVIVQAPDGSVSIDGSSVGQMTAFIRKGKKHIPLTRPVTGPFTTMLGGADAAPDLRNFTYFAASGDPGDSMYIMTPAVLKSLTPFYHALTPREALEKRLKSGYFENVLTEEEIATIKREDIFKSLDSWDQEMEDPKVSALLKKLENAYVSSLLEQIHAYSEKVHKPFSNCIVDFCTRLPKQVKLAKEQGLPYEFAALAKPGTLLEFGSKKVTAKGVVDNFSCTEITF